MLERQGIKLDRSTLANWVGRACWWLTPLYDLMLGTVLASPKVFADDTTLPVLDPGRGRTKTGRLWCYAVDDRPWCGPGHPIAAYVYSDDRKNERPAGHLATFRGVLQVDGYNGFKKLAGDRADASVTLAFCWTHMRRYFYEFYVSTKSPLAGETLARIRELYAIEAEIRGHPDEHRRQVRQTRSRPIVEALHVWLHEQVDRVSSSSDLAKAIPLCHPTLARLVVFLDDGSRRNGHQRGRTVRSGQTRLLAKTRFLQAPTGGAHHWALAMTLIPTAKLNGRRPDGLAHQRARAPRLWTDQDPRVAHSAALELASFQHRAGHGAGCLNSQQRCPPQIHKRYPVDPCCPFRHHITGTRPTARCRRRDAYPEDAVCAICRRLRVVLRLQPLARPVDLQAGIVDQYMRRPVRHRGRLDHRQRHCPATDRGVIRR